MLKIGAIVGVLIFWYFVIVKGFVLLKKVLFFNKINNMIKWIVFNQVKIKGLNTRDIIKIKKFLQTNEKITLVSGNDIKYIADSLDMMQSVKHLEIINFSNVKKMPKTLSLLTNLESIYVSNMNLKKFPKELCKIKNIKSIVIHNCPRIIDIPKCIYELENLETLSINDMGSSDEDIKYIQQSPKNQSNNQDNQDNQDDQDSQDNQNSQEKSGTSQKKQNILKSLFSFRKSKKQPQEAKIVEKSRKSRPTNKQTKTAKQTKLSTTNKPKNDTKPKEELSKEDKMSQILNIEIPNLDKNIKSLQTELQKLQKDHDMYSKNSEFLTEREKKHANEIYSKILEKQKTLSSLTLKREKLVKELF